MKNKSRGSYLGVLTLIATPLFAQGPFAKIGLLQGAASPVLSSVEWKDLGDGAGYYGSSTFKVGEHLVPTTVRYSITGKTRAKVDQAMISAFVASPDHLVPARAKVAAAAGQWFKSVGKAVPQGLLQAIRSGSPFTRRADGISTILKIERGVNPGVIQPDGSRYIITSIDLSFEPL